MLIGDMIAIHGRKYPKKTALVYGDIKFTFAELDARVNRLSQALVQLGIKPGDRVAMRARNCPQFIEFFFAAAKCGAIAVPINPYYKQRELEYLIRDSSPKVVIISQEDIPFIQSISAADLNVETYICIQKEFPGFRSYDKLIELAQPIEPSIRVAEEDPAMIVYTSGTTGIPKGVTLSHKNCLTDARHVVIEMLLEDHHVVMLIFPLFHAAGISILFRTFYIGATLVMGVNTNPGGILNTMEREKVTHIIIVPTLLNAICNTPEVHSCDLSSLKLIVYGGAIMPVEQLKRAMNIFKCGFMNGYGTTEAGPTISVLKPVEHIRALADENQKKKLASCGRAIVGVETRVVDSEDREVSVGEVGELCARGENIMMGYWGKPEDTQNALRNGWLHTGDLVRMDEEGYIYIIDRLKDIIISGGENISSREVEEVLYEHPDVLEAAVIGVPDPYWGESVKAVVVLKDKASITEDELIGFCKQRLSSFKKPKSIDFVKELPKNPQGKILKAELRKRYLVK